MLRGVRSHLTVFGGLCLRDTFWNRLKMVALPAFLVLVMTGVAATVGGAAATVDFARLTADLEQQTGDVSVREPHVRLLLRGTFVLLAVAGLGFILLGFLLGFGILE